VDLKHQNGHDNVVQLSLARFSPDIKYLRTTTLRGVSYSNDLMALTTATITTTTSYNCTDGSFTEACHRSHWTIRLDCSLKDLDIIQTVAILQIFREYYYILSIVFNLVWGANEWWRDVYRYLISFLHGDTDFQCQLRYSLPCVFEKNLQREDPGSPAREYPDPVISVRVFNCTPSSPSRLGRITSDLSIMTDLFTQPIGTDPPLSMFQRRDNHPVSRANLG